MTRSKEGYLCGTPDCEHYTFSRCRHHCWHCRRYYADQCKKKNLAANDQNL